MLGTALSLGQAHLAPRWWPEGAIFAADFVNNRFMSGGIAIPAASAYSFSRASTKRAQSRDGTWHLFAPDVPAITDRGLLLEPATTNLLPNSAFVGGIPATHTTTGSANLPTGYTIRNLPAGCIAETAYGTESGLPYMDIRIHGTATNNTPFVLALSPNDAIPCTAGQSLWISLSARLVAGAVPSSATFRMYEYNAEGTNNSTSDLPALDLTLGHQRFDRMYVISGANTVTCLDTLRLGVGVGASVDVTVRISCPQAEAHAGRTTSPILTTATPLVREADILLVALPNGSNSVRYDLSDTTAIVQAAASGQLLVPTNLISKELQALAVFT